MTKFNLPHGYYIRNYDSKNWIVAKKMTAKSGKQKEYIQSYHPYLSYAFSSALDMLSLQAKDLPELEGIVSRMEKLKKDIQ